MNEQGFGNIEGTVLRERLVPGSEVAEEISFGFGARCVIRPCAGALAVEIQIVFGGHVIRVETESEFKVLRGVSEVVRLLEIDAPGIDSAREIGRNESAVGEIFAAERFDAANEAFLLFPKIRPRLQLLRRETRRIDHVWGVTL